MELAVFLVASRGWRSFGRARGWSTVWRKTKAGGRLMWPKKIPSKPQDDAERQAAAAQSLHRGLMTDF
jgi:hypothetical protein